MTEVFNIDIQRHRRVPPPGNPLSSLSGGSGDGGSQFNHVQRAACFRRIVDVVDNKIKPGIAFSDMLAGL